MLYNLHMEEFLSEHVLEILLVSLWDTVWKGIAMWRASRRNQLGWFIVLFVANTVGVLPIIYLLTHREKKELDQTVV